TIYAQSRKLLAGLIELRQENPFFPNYGRRQARSDWSFPADILSWTKVNRRCAFAQSSGIRSSKLGPPGLAPVLCRDNHVCENCACQKRNQNRSFHDSFP